MNDKGNKLILLVGWPRAGKSFWAQAQGFPIVNPDSIRLALHGQRYLEAAEPIVWAAAKLFVKSLFLAGHRIVILDACNNTRSRRDDWHSFEWDNYFHHVDTPASLCLERAADEGDAYIMPIIERMAANFEPLQWDELPWDPDDPLLEAR